ncbi:uncharacterized protein FA14DRAFT_177955 [Meira miltonrushii]|uniref:Invertebrate defensins family profile domain-containing protein n=1 Tax=Meira miltonrushii TaxID=1280837 RepID=A0A316VAB2_9BASI|nr:uncharacterized protein FA14DRAFT_177955 [Meira miltonrushii]PWN34549.1 hypothetical protein FA14DRAFT_177955 [Meira miltonrushii]
MMSSTMNKLYFIIAITVVLLQVSQVESLPVRQFTNVEQRQTPFSSIKRDDSSSQQPMNAGTSAAACYGSCPGRGQAYTGRACKAVYGCQSGSS